MPVDFKIKSFSALAGLTFSVLFFTGCFMAPEDGVDMHPARVTLELTLAPSQVVSKSKSGLGKFSGSGLRRMVVLMTSNRQDTLCDTITSRGSQLSSEPVSLGAGHDLQTVNVLYSLAPHRHWKVTVKVSDTLDSLWYVDTATVEGLKAFDRRTVAMTLNPHYAVYSAQFPLPELVETHQVYFTRLTLSVDGVLVTDSNVLSNTGLAGTHAFATADSVQLLGSVGKHFFKDVTRGGAISLEYEYMHSDSCEVVLSAYGYLAGDTVGITPMRLLYQGGNNISVALGKATAQESVPLDFMAPIQGNTAPDETNTQLVVQIGKIGSLIVNVTLSGEIDF